MNWLSKISSWQIHRGLLAFVSATIGAGATVCLLGIPKMWSAEAAGWATAVGTVAAVVLSLYLASQQGRKEKKASRSRARWVALELRQVLGQWRGRIAYAHYADGADLYFLLDDEGLPAPTVVPPDLISLYDQLHELGDDAAPIADAIWIARQLHRMPIGRALRGDMDPKIAAVVEEQFRAGLSSLLKHLHHAEHNVSAITGLSSADAESQTFGGPSTL